MPIAGTNVTLADVDTADEVTINATNMMDAERSDGDSADDFMTDGGEIVSLIYKVEMEDKKGRDFTCF